MAEKLIFFKTIELFHPIPLQFTVKFVYYIVEIYAPLTERGYEEQNYISAKGNKNQK